MKEYKIAKGWAIFMYIGAPILIALFGLMLFLPFMPGEDVPVEALWFLAPISLLMIGIMILGLVDTVTGRFVIDKDRIYTKNVFNNRMLLLTEIKGFRIDDKYIFVEPSVPNKKRVKISTYYGKNDEIREWLYEHYSDLDLMNMIEETKEIYTNVEFGANEEMRERRLHKARKAATILNTVAIVVSVWALFYPYPYGVLLVTLLFMPVLAILLVKMFGGIIRLDAQQSLSAYPTVLYSIAIPGFILVMRAMVDYNLLEYSNTWLPSILLTILALTILLIGNKEFSFEKGREYITLVGVVIFFFCYSYGALIFTNCYFDRSTAKVIYVKVMSKWISSGKHASYYVQLEPWDKQTEPEELSISSDLYDKLHEGQKAAVYLSKGLFDIPWVKVSE